MSFHALHSPWCSRPAPQAHTGYGSYGAQHVTCSCHINPPFRCLLQTPLCPACGSRSHPLIIPADLHNHAYPRVWRLDSGSFESVAELVVGTWEAQCAAARSRGLPEPPPPHLMHSNLGSVEEVLQAAALPPRIRPHVVAFGTLADGYLPMQLPAPGGAGAGEEVQVQLASLVMKAVQARPDAGTGQAAAGARQVRAGAGEGLEPARRACHGAGCGSYVLGAAQHLPVGISSDLHLLGTCLQASSIKLGDGGTSKLEVDPRLGAEQRAEMLQLAQRMADVQLGQLDEAAVSQAVAHAYQQAKQGAWQ